MSGNNAITRAYERSYRYVFHRQAILLPQYSSGLLETPKWRRFGMFAAKLLLAAAYGGMVVLLPPSTLTLLAVPIGVMLLLTLWMLPDRATYPLGAIEAVYPVFLASNAIWPVYIALALPGLPWVTPTRLLLFMLTFLLLYSVSTSSKLRHHLLTVARASAAMWIAFVLWEIMQVVTLPFSKAIGASVKDLFDNQFRLVGMLFLGCLLFTKRGMATKTALALVILATVISLDGFIELKLGYPPWANHIPSFMRVDEAYLTNVLGSQARSADGLYRVRGPFPNSLLLAEFLALCIPFILHWVLTARALQHRIFAALSFLLVFGAIIETQARLGLIGILVAVLSYTPAWAYRRWRADRGGLIGPAIVLGFPAIAAMMIIVILSSTTLSHRVLGGGAQSASDESRRMQRQMAVPKIIRNPVGYGLGQSGVVLNFVSTSGYLTIDSGYITTVLDLGVVGFFSLYGLMLIGTWNGVRLYLFAKDRETELGGPIAVTLLVFVVLKLVVSQENNNPIVFLLLGMLLALKAREDGIVPGVDQGATGEIRQSAPQDTPSLAAAASSVPRIAG